MTETAIHQALHDAVVEVLEKMFFIEATGTMVSENDAGAPALTVAMTFDGEPPGTFRISMPEAGAVLIAADFLGEDASSLTGRQVGEVAKELANMICGAVLSRIERSATFRLSAPDLVNGQGADDHTFQGTVCAMETGSGILRAGINMEAKACPRTARSAF